jgi:hypothetical protein
LRQRVASRVVLPSARSAGDVVAGLRVAARAGNDHAMQRRVDLAVAASVEPPALRLSRAGGGRCDARRAGEPGRCGEALSAGDLADELGGHQRPEARLAEQLRCDLPDELADLALELVDRLRELAQSAQLVARDPNAHRLLRAGQPPADRRAALLCDQRAAGQPQLGPQVVQMPLQRAVELDAMADESFAVLDEQPQIELGPIAVRGRERGQAFLQRGASDVQRVDRV